MSSQFHNKVYNHFLVFFICICVWVIYCTVHAAPSEVNDTGIQCVKSERAALLRFKQGIRVDSCGLLNSWGDSLDCCQWHGIHCSNRSGHVIGLRLPGTDDDSYTACLEGTLSESLLELKHLKYLDLSLNNFTEQLPKFIGSLDALEDLNLSNAGFLGVVPQEIGNLSRLSSLDLNSEYNLGSIMRVKNLRWLSHLRLLKQLDLSGVDLSAATNMWLPIVNSLPFLQVLRLEDCQLSFKLPPSLSYINSSSTLNVVSLEILDLSFNQKLFGNNVKVSGHALQFLGRLCSLQTLFLSGTGLKYDFSKIVQSFSACPHKALASLDLSGNQIWGSIPDNINSLLSLRELDLHECQLNGSISQSLWGLPMLESLDLTFNALKAVVTEDHLSNLSKLRELDLGYNTGVVVNISADWIPPFQLEGLSLDFCKVGPDFPIWLTTQKYLTYIHLRNTSISSRIPISFFNSLSTNLQELDMSQNMMHGVLPDVSLIFDSPPYYIDLSSNNFHGKLPSFLRNVSQLYLSNNNLSQGLVPFLCPHNKMPLQSLDLSSNLFSDKLPDYWKYFDNLVELNLQNNMLWGNLPTTIGALDSLTILQLGRNNISGQLHSSLLSWKSLAILDISHNSLTGNIPSNVWDRFKNLSLLMLGSNNLSGDLPSSFCQLSQIQILDLSNNLISGLIPKCIYNLRGMANNDNVLENIFENGAPADYVFDGEEMMWKRTESFFQGSGTLGQAKTIDFSNNKLEGDIPEGISSLIGLVTLNLSTNHLSGAIPSKIGQLTSLETLDLSHNHLSGEIPLSLAEINPLGVLDLSYNNLSGKIPTAPHLQTFDNSTYIGNPGLCGAPLPKCPGDEATTISQNGSNVTPHHEHHLDDFMLGLYISVVLGFITGFWGVCGTLVLKRSWRHAFFRFYDDTKDRIYVIMVVHVAKAGRRS